MAEPKHPTPTSKSEMNSPAAKPAPAPPKVESRVTGPYDDLIAASGLNPGEVGYLQLDDAGVPTGLTAVMPATGMVNVCRALVRPASANFAQLTTVTGADLVPPLNPDPDYRMPDPEPPVLRTSRHDARRAAGKKAEAEAEAKLKAA